MKWSLIISLIVATIVLSSCSSEDVIMLGSSTGGGNNTYYNNYSYYNITQTNNITNNITNNLTNNITNNITNNNNNNYYTTNSVGGFINDSTDTNTTLHANIGSQLTFNFNGVQKWIDDTYQNGIQNFMYIGRNALTNVNGITLSQGGRMGIQQPSNNIGDDSYFNGTGQNNFNVMGSFTGDYPRTYIFTIFNNTQVGYKYSIDGLPLQATYVSNWTLNLSNIAIEENLTVNWTNITSGIINGSTWIFTAYPRVPHGTLSIYNPIFEYAFFYNVSNNFYLDRKYESSTTQQGVSIFNDSFKFLDTNQSNFYVGRPIPFRSVALVFSVVASNTNATVWYCNGTNTWNLLNVTTHLFIDGTKNYTQSGTMTWDVSTLNWSNNCSINNVTNIYWMMFNSSNNIVTKPFLYSIIPLGLNRFEIFDSGGDVFPSVYFDSDANNFNMTKNRLTVSGITNTGTLITPSVTSSGGVAVGGALSGATTGAFSSTSTFGGTMTESVASTLNTLSLYGLVLTSATATTTGVPNQGSTLLTFRHKIWNGTADTNQEWSFGTIGDNTTKTTSLVLKNMDYMNGNTSILNITHSINSNVTDMNVTWGNTTKIMMYATDNTSQRMCYSVWQNGTDGWVKC